MIKKGAFIFWIMMLCVQNCVAPQFSRSNIPWAKQIEWERILQNSEQKYNTLSASNLLSYVRMFLGTSYHKSGTTLRGVDCSGFVMTVFKKASNINLPHNAALMYKQTIPISLKKIRLGDLLFFENYKGKGISHVGIYLIDTKFVHASTSYGVTISCLTKNYYRQRFKGARRIADFRL